MKTLRKGDRGTEVGVLQEKLIAVGYRLIPDSHFWDKTDIAVRDFQRKKGMIPDGVVGRKTWLALGVRDESNSTITQSSLLNDFFAIFGSAGVTAATRAQNSPASNQPSRPVSHLRTSEKGHQFIYTREAWAGRSNILHWPGGSSGVTLGPGYDMKERTETEITNHMLALGVPFDKAKKIAQGAGLTKERAEEFCDDNEDLVKLKNNEEYALLKIIVPTYEARVKNKITINLMQHEFDALVCFAYNPGGKMTRLAGYVNQGKIALSMDTIKSANTSGGVVNNGLIKRRELEVTLYMYNNYGKLRII